MKKINALIIFAAVTLLLNACNNKPNIDGTSGTKSTEAVITSDSIGEASDTDPQYASEKLCQKLEGFYHEIANENPDESDHVIDVSYSAGVILVNNSLLIDGCVYSYWAQEILPDDMSELNSTSLTQFEGMSMSFSNMSVGGDYWDEKLTATVSLTDSGIVIAEKSNDTVVKHIFERTERSEWLPQPDLATDTAVNLDVSMVNKLSGEWIYISNVCEAYFTLGREGNLLYAMKRRGIPINALTGTWKINADGTIAVTAEKLGSGSMPFEFTLNYTTDADSMLLLDIGENKMLPEDGVNVFGKADGDETFSAELYNSSTADISGEFYDKVCGVWKEAENDVSSTISFVDLSVISVLNSGVYPGEFDRDCMITGINKNSDGSFTLDLFFPAVQESEMYDAEPAAAGNIIISSTDGYNNSLVVRYSDGSATEYIFVADTWEEAVKTFESTQLPSDEPCYVPESWKDALEGYWVYTGKDRESSTQIIYYFTGDGEVYISPELYYEAVNNSDGRYVFHNEWAVVNDTVIYTDIDVAADLEPIEYILTLTDESHMVLFDSNDGETLTFERINM